ncbi:hypothetical protein NSE01_17640 [Novosphingobium sediminis]|uniref:Metalloenzyme domain-containing protein n=1 Tax=Novosphingobium sediminis TaxID=707214 RepID=A0A512AJP8_9SPHN|nr:alkaline phosphatase family protein [Novosphingobium sediminis]GEN99931.1 hypothetical protein NSE01_17640 [Novosphingobium sediminis]
MIELVKDQRGSPVRRIILALTIVLLSPAFARAEAPADGQRLILVTMDGTRWQEVFRGPDKALVAEPKFTDPDRQQTIEQAWGSGPAVMPFLHSLPAQGGVLYGNRDAGDCMRLTNPMWFSYPGYNEMLTGRPDPAITTNDKIWNRNVTFLEWLNHRPGFAGKVRVYATWDVFPYIINEQRSGVPVNAESPGARPTETRTMRLAQQALRSANGLRVLYVALGDTDTFGHEGNYAQYLASMNRDDDFIAELWRMAQADPAWRGRTTLIVTTDHGRGAKPGAYWKEHGSAAAWKLNSPDYTIADPEGFKGSDEIWLAAIGPGAHAAPVGSACFTQGQVAASALTALGEDWKAFDAGAAAPLPFFTGR